MVDENRLGTMKDYRRFVRELIRFYESKSVAEIGVWKGALSYTLMRLHLKRLVLVDPFDPHLPHCSKRNHSQGELDGMYESILKRMPMHCEFYRLESVLAAGIFKDEELDFVFIDANHWQCAEDIDAWWPIVKKGGVLAGDDYVQMPAVRKAVDSRFPNVETSGRVGLILPLLINLHLQIQFHAASSSAEQIQGHIPRFSDSYRQRKFPHILHKLFCNSQPICNLIHQSQIV